MFCSTKMIIRSQIDFNKQQTLWKSIPKHIKCNVQKCNRYYHSGTEVYGYKPNRRKYFEVSPKKLEVRSKYSNFYRFVTAYREHAHKQANINPVSETEPELIHELYPTNFFLHLNDEVPLDEFFITNKKNGTIADAVKFLHDTYSSSIGVEFSYLETEEEREWFTEHYETIYHEPINKDIKVAIAEEMLKSQAFDNFLAIKFVSLKRYGGEGAESMMAFFYEFFRLCANGGDLKELIICMPHRGRLNFLTGMLNFPPEKIFYKLKGFSEFPNDIKATGDVISHMVSSTDLNLNGKQLHVTMLYNPSHLEAVNPVSMGKTRAVMQELKDGAYSDDNATWSDKVLNLQVHGDAAYSGQGINQECLMLSGAPHFEIGGTVHLVVNNQLGFTTPANRGRSSRYCTDLAKMISAPVLHVNGDDPEMVVRTTKIAFQYQRKFRKDVFVDLNCFRRWGHNEMDDPTFTNPLMYKIIHNRKSIPDKYLDHLVSSNIMTLDQGKEITRKHNAWLAEALKQAESYEPKPTYFTNRWSSMTQAQSSVTTWDTGVDLNLLKFIAAKSVEYKPNMKIHPTLLKSHIQPRLKKINNNLPVDWSTAEAMAIGSLLYSGHHVRISGQDIGRGTFSQRHAMLIDQLTGDMFIPLNSMVEGQTGKLELANSILSEEAVLGFEYGVSIVSPFTLTIWEAQFGDFFNGAQIIIDTFITSGETKWMNNTGLVMLLPHGYDGAGPEHSSCRLERFLQLTDSNENQPDGDDVNIQVVNPTTPAQYFHILRKQIVRNFRKPLIMVAPKILLRHSSANSQLSDMMPNTYFKNIIGDDSVDENNVKKVIFVTGKHYYALAQKRQDLGIKDAAIIRIECLCPFPISELFDCITRYHNAKQFIWSQEEPQNMGAWNFVKSRFENLCGKRITYCGRKSLPAPAVGVGKIHVEEAEEIILQPLRMKIY